MIVLMPLRVKETPNGQVVNLGLRSAEKVLAIPVEI